MKEETRQPPTHDAQQKVHGSQNFEYRVVWKREGDKRPRTKVYQTARGAEQWMDTLKGNYEASDEYRAFIADAAKPLIEVGIERRPVGEWEGP